VSPMVNVHEAKTNLSKLPDLAHSGQEIMLARAGNPYARLMPPGVISDGSNDVLVSAASAWEIAIRSAFEQFDVETLW